MVVLKDLEVVFLAVVLSERLECRNKRSGPVVMHTKRSAEGRSIGRYSFAKRESERGR